jgi:predicted transcriptional regulator
MSDGDTTSTIPGLTAEIVSAYVSHHSIATADIGRLVGVVAEELGGLGRAPEPPTRPQPAVPVRDSVHRDRLVCLVCGKPFKSLRRHLRISHELTPPAYRERFGLARDYPMVAAASSEQRAAIARRSGLGLRRTSEPVDVPPVPAEAPPTRATGGTTRRKTVAAAATTSQPALRPVRGRRAAKVADVTSGIDLVQQPQPQPESEPTPKRQPRRKAEVEPG